MFYLISTQNLKDGTNPCSIAAYTNKNEALSAFHSTMASNYLSTTMTSCSCYVTNEIGGVIKTDYILFNETTVVPDEEG